jgi:chromosome segregation ATPase
LTERAAFTEQLEEVRASLMEETKQAVAGVLAEQGVALDRALVSITGDKDTRTAQETSKLEGLLRDMGGKIEASVDKRIESWEKKAQAMADQAAATQQATEGTVTAAAASSMMIASLREEVEEMNRHLLDCQERLTNAEGQGLELAGALAKEKDKATAAASSSSTSTAAGAGAANQAVAASMEPLNDTDASLLQLALTKLQQHATRSDAKLNDVTTSVAKMNVRSMQVGPRPFKHPSQIIPRPVKHTRLHPHPSFVDNHTILRRLTRKLTNRLTTD